MRVLEVILPLVVIIALVLLLSWLTSLFIKNRQKRYLLITVFLVFFFSYGQLISLLTGEQFKLGSLNIDPDLIVFPIWFILLFVALWFLLRTKRDLSKLSSFLTITASLLVAIQLVMGSYIMVASRGTLSENKTDTIFSSKTSAYPDIYYIILDGFGRHDVLKTIYNYDNSDFLDFLRGKGFYLASSLNMNYVHVLGRFNPKSFDRAPLGKVFANNLLCRFLKSHGYSIGVFSSGVYHTEIDKTDNYYTPGLTLSEFHNSIINLTPVAALLSKVKSQFDIQRERINYALEKIPDTHEINSPKFIYSHLLCPHPPFVFGPNGEKHDRNRPFTIGDGSHYFKQGGTLEEYKNGYRGQAQYLSNRLKKTISEILANSKRPPIIILQGDHGPGSGLDWQKVRNTNLFERFSNFNVFYFPDGNYDNLYDSITPVNSFRIVLNQFFGTNLEILPDKLYYTSRTRPYLFVDVTEELNKTDQ